MRNRRLQKLLVTIITVAALFFTLTLATKEVLAQCAVGYYCFGTTETWVVSSCKPFGSGGSQYCGNDEVYTDFPLNCNAKCLVSYNTCDCANTAGTRDAYGDLVSCTPCNRLTIITNCCAIGGPTPSPTPLPCTPGATTCGNCSVSCGGGTQTCTDGCSTWYPACNPQVCIPNCLNVSGPSQIILPNTGNYSADFTSPEADLRGEIFYNSPGNVIQNTWFGFVTSGTISNAPWTPPAVGSYTVCCRAWNDAKAECRPPAFVDVPPRYPCSGPGYCMTVNVTPSCEITAYDVSLEGSGDKKVTNPITPGYITPGYSILNVLFTINPPAGVAQITGALPNPDITASYRVEIQSLSIGSTTYTATATLNDAGATKCSSTADIYVNNPSAWWQTVGGDLIAGGGNINSVIPAPEVCALPSCNPLLILDNLEGYPGVAAASGSITPGTGVSSTNWQAAGAPYLGSVLYDYAFFEKKAQNITFNSLGSSSITNVSQLTSGPLINGYYWNKYDGDSFGAPLTISNPLDLGGSKIVLFVKNASLTVGGKVNVADGTATFIAIVNRDINVSPSVGGTSDNIPELEGIYLADGQIKTGTSGVANDLQLHVRGSLSGLGIPAGGGTPGTKDGVVLERNLANNSLTPGELFEFAPDQLFLFPSILSHKNITWREVAP